MSRQKIIGVFVLVALFIMPAMSMQGWMRDDRRCDFGRGIGPTAGIALLLDDITQEELDNMTLAEIRELREKNRSERDNMTLAEIRELREKKMAEMSNTTLAELKERRGLAGPGPDGGRYGGPQAGLMACPGVGPFCGIELLLDDITQEELDNMTLAEIREFREKKRAEMDNMTLAEIRELREKKMAEMSNTTLAELRGGRGAGYTECPYWPMGGAREGAPRDGWGFRKMQR